MSEVISLAQAREDRSERWRAYITDEVEHWGKCFAEWHAKSGDERAAVAEHLASEIIQRYSPIAKQFRALYDVVALYMAAAQERGEDMDVAALKGLTIMMGDERYIQLAVHVGRERVLAEYKFDALSALKYRQNDPSVVDKLCDEVFKHYMGLRKK